MDNSLSYLDSALEEFHDKRYKPMGGHKVKVEDSVLLNNYDSTKTLKENANQFNLNPSSLSRRLKKLGLYRTKVRIKNRGLSLRYILKKLLRHGKVPCRERRRCSCR